MLAQIDGEVPVHGLRGARQREQLLIAVEVGDRRVAVEGPRREVALGGAQASHQRRVLHQVVLGEPVDDVEEPALEHRGGERAPLVGLDPDQPAVRIANPPQRRDGGTGRRGLDRLVDQDGVETGHLAPVGQGEVLHLGDSGEAAVIPLPIGRRAGHLRGHQRRHVGRSLGSDDGNRRGHAAAAIIESATRPQLSERACAT